MNTYYPYLDDKEFLKELDLLPLKTQYVKITVLNWDETPVQEIQGKIQSGSVSLNGNSSIRRTCNLIMVAEKTETDFTNINSLISIGKKINLEIGFLNILNDYKDFKIIWFPLGVYVIAGANISHNTMQLNISLTLKDKMCLLNGEFGGVIPASVNLDKVDIVNEDGTVSNRQLHLIEILQYVLTEFGGESIDNIIINDIDPQIKEVIKWIGETPFYLVHVTNSTGHQITPSTVKPEQETNREEFTYGMDIGYLYKDFVYNKDLTVDAGTFVTSVLDTIKNYLGNFEYFYDINGKFIFQEIKNYLNTTEATEIITELSNANYFTDLGHSKSMYIFDNKIATDFTNNPQYPQIKNDYVIWGARQSTTGNKLPIRYHLTIDNKPTLSQSPYYCQFNEKGQLTAVEITTQSSDSWTPILPQDWRTELYIRGFLSQKDRINHYDVQASYYFAELHAEWHKIYDIKTQTWKIQENNQDTLDYFLDFVDSPDLDSIKVSTIGRRGKVLKNDAVNCIIEPIIPDYVFVEAGNNNTEDYYKKRGEQSVQMDESLIAQTSIGGASNGALSTIRSLLQEHTRYNESISFSSLPIYYLEPNSRVTVRDTDSQIYGDYIINSITLPLDIASTMSISATRAIDRV